MADTQLKCPNCGADAVERAEGVPTWDDDSKLVACTDLKNCACGHDTVGCDCTLHTA